MNTENIQQAFKKKFVRKNVQTGEYQLGWFLRETVTGRDVWLFIKEKVIPAVRKESYDQGYDLGYLDGKKEFEKDL